MLSYIFKAIVALADGLSLPLSVAFATGGAPFLVDLKADLFFAHFVIATTDFDGGDADGLPKVERTPAETKPAPAERAQSVKRNVAPAACSSGPSRVPSAARPLFNPPSPNEMAAEDEDGFGELAFGEEDFAAIDRLSQMPVMDMGGPGRGASALAMDAGQEAEGAEADGELLMTHSDRFAKSEAAGQGRPYSVLP